MNKKKTLKAGRFIRGSGNVFADLGLPNAEERLAKAKLARQICVLISRLKLNQTQAAQRLGADQPKVSALMHGRLEGFSTERLIKFLNALDCDVLLSIRPAETPHHASFKVEVANA